MSLHELGATAELAARIAAVEQFLDYKHLGWRNKRRCNASVNVGGGNARCDRSERHAGEHRHEQPLSGVVVTWPNYADEEVGQGA